MQCPIVLDHHVAMVQHSFMDCILLYDSVLCLYNRQTQHKVMGVSSKKTTGVRSYTILFVKNIK
jgi:hypothetical protein